MRIITVLAGLGAAWWIFSRKDSGATAAPVPAPAPAPAAPRPADTPATGGSDDLTRINGIGPKLAEKLNTLGITRFDQIAAWSSTDIAEFDEHLGRFKGRAVRDDWIGQAKILAHGAG